MKKRILVAVASVVLAALILLLLPLSTPQTTPTESTAATPSGTNHTTQPSDQPTNPSNVPDAEGVVRLYSCDDGFLAGFESLAAEYTALTGVEVVVLRPEADGCQETLKRFMESEDPPTVLCVHSQRQLKNWSHTLLDLQGTPLAAALSNQDLGLWLGSKMQGVPAGVEDVSENFPRYSTPQVL